MTRRPKADSDLPEEPPLSLNQKILEEIRGKILSGQWPPGFRIPFEHELTEQFSCSRMTVNKALSQLASAGLIERRRRSGSFVASPKSQESTLKIHDIKAEIIGAGHTYRFTVLSRSIRTATQIDADHLKIKKNVPVLSLMVLHDAADLPFVLEERIINLAAVPLAAKETFSDSPPGSWLLDLIPWTEAEHIIRAVSANADIAKKLGIASQAACLVVERRTWQHGDAITWVRLTYPGTRHQLVSSLKPGSTLG